MKTELNPKIKAIVSKLYETEGMITANEISKSTGVSYTVVQKYLNILEEKGIVCLHREWNKKNTKKYTGRSESKRYILNPLLVLEKYGLPEINPA